MARIAGVNIPSQKKLGIALTYVYGVGRKYSVDICKQAEVDQNIRVQDLSEVDIKKITDVISADFTVEDIQEKAEQKHSHEDTDSPGDCRLAILRARRALPRVLPAVVAGLAYAA